MNPAPDIADIFWQPANEFIDRQTQAIAREFKTSRPRPRNRAMGFKGQDRRQPTIRQEIEAWTRTE